MRSKALCVMTMASGEFSVAAATKARRRSAEKFSSSATMMLASGYNSMNSLANCSSMWFGTTYIGLRIRPRRFCSMPPAIISIVLPAPTACAR